MKCILTKIKATRSESKMCKFKERKTKPRCLFILETDKWIFPPNSYSLSKGLKTIKSWQWHSIKSAKYKEDNDFLMTGL